MLVFHSPAECLEEVFVPPDPVVGESFVQNDVVLCIDDCAVWSLCKVVLVHTSERQYTVRQLEVLKGERHGAWADVLGRSVSIRSTRLFLLRFAVQSWSCVTIA